jgi:hypothetical protein
MFLCVILFLGFLMLVSIHFLVFKYDEHLAAMSQKKTNDTNFRFFIYQGQQWVQNPVM